MTNKEVRNNFVQNLAENAYINMCSAEEMNIAINRSLEKQEYYLMNYQVKREKEITAMHRFNEIKE